MNLFFKRRLFSPPAKSFARMFFLTAGIWLLAGCHKKAAVVVAAESNSPSAQVAGSGPITVAGSGPHMVPVAVPADVDASGQLAQLTQVLRRYGVDHRRVPQSFNEIITAGYLAALPAAPAGKQFAIDAKHMQVILEHR